MLVAEGRIRGIIKMMPLRTFSGNTNCSGSTTRRSGFSYDWYRLEAPGSVFAASAVESAILVRPFSEKNSIRRGSIKSEKGIGFRSEEWCRDPFPAPFSF